MGLTFVKLYYQDSQSTIFEYRYRGIYAVVLMEKVSFIRVECSLCKKVLLGREKKRQKKNTGREKKRKKQFSNLFKNVFFIYLLYFIYLYLHLLYDIVFGVLPIYIVIILLSSFFNTFTIQLFRSAVQFLFFSQILTTLVAKPKKI